MTYRITDPRFPTEQRFLYCAGYWNAGWPICIVVAAPDVHGHFAAYIGTGEYRDEREAQTLVRVAEYGVKLTHEETLRMLPPALLAELGGIEQRRA